MWHVKRWGKWQWPSHSCTSLQIFEFKTDVWQGGQTLSIISQTLSFCSHLSNCASYIFPWFIFLICLLRLIIHRSPTLPVCSERKALLKIRSCRLSLYQTALSCPACSQSHSYSSQQLFLRQRIDWSSLFRSSQSFHTQRRVNSFVSIFPAL